MSATYHAITVVLDRDFRQEEVDATIAAIRQLRHVLSAEPREVDNLAYLVADTRIRADLSQKLYATLYPTKTP